MQRRKREKEEESKKQQSLFNHSKKKEKKKVILRNNDRANLSNGKGEKNLLKVSMSKETRKLLRSSKSILMIKEKRL